ncbi:MAG: hypothetical protein AB8I08_03860 [Sandaracinaceae bacterium]
MLRLNSLTLALFLVACGGEVRSDAGSPDAQVRDAGAVDSGPVDGGPMDAALSDAGDAGPNDAGPDDAGPDDSGLTDAGADAATSCLEDHAAGERYSLGDNCNFCDCMADGSSLCTSRVCAGVGPGCTYDGVDYGYGARFASTDGVNECVCAASGLACTRRDSELAEEGAILLESLDTPCGEDSTFTPRTVLDTIPIDDFTAAFPYDRAREFSPETLPDSEIRVRLTYDDGFLVCRIPSPTQPALDIEAVVEFITADGAFDEAFHTYLRRNNFGFVDAWTTVASAPNDGLDGSYVPPCTILPSGFGFNAQVDADGTASGSIRRTCEGDISVAVGSFAYAP